MSQGVCCRAGAARQKLVATDVEVMSGRVTQLNEFIVTRVAYSVVIRVARSSVRRISQHFIEENVADRISAKRNRDGVAGAAIRLNKQIDCSRTAKIAWHPDAHFVKARHVGRSDYSFGVSYSTADCDGILRSTTRASSKYYQAQVAVGRIEWPFLQQVVA